MIIDTDEYVTVAEFAKKVGVNPQNIRPYLLNNTLKHVRLGGFFFVHKDSYALWDGRFRKLGRPRKE